MNVRFVIRKGPDPRYPWEVRDALCSSCEVHDFMMNRAWSNECAGRCDAYPTIEEAIEDASFYGRTGQ